MSGFSGKQINSAFTERAAIQVFEISICLLMIYKERFLLHRLDFIANLDKLPLEIVSYILHCKYHYLKKQYIYKIIFLRIFNV